MCKIFPNTIECRLADEADIESDEPLYFVSYRWKNDFQVMPFEVVHVNAKNRAQAVEKAIRARVSSFMLTKELIEFIKAKFRF